MNHYRIYALNASGRITSGIDVACPDDAAAFGHAASLFGVSGGTEIWQGARFVGRHRPGAGCLDAAALPPPPAGASGHDTWI